MDSGNMLCEAVLQGFKKENRTDEEQLSIMGLVLHNIESQNYSGGKDLKDYQVQPQNTLQQELKQCCTVHNIANRYEQAALLIIVFIVQNFQVYLEEVSFMMRNHF